MKFISIATLFATILAPGLAAEASGPEAAAVPVADISPVEATPEAAIGDEKRELRGGSATENNKDNRARRKMKSNGDYSGGMCRLCCNDDDWHGC